MLKREQLIEFIEEGKHEEIVLAYLPLVKYHARLHLGRSTLSLDDLIDEGVIAIYAAINNFDESFGTHFSAYASIHIKERMYRAIMKHRNIINIPYKIQKLIPKVLQLSNQGYSDSQIKNQLELDDELYKRIESALKAFSPCEYADHLYREDTNELIGFEIRDQVSQLDENRQYVINSIFGLNDYPIKTLEIIGRDLGITRQRAHQLFQSALKRLRNSLHSQGQIQ